MAEFTIIERYCKGLGVSHPETTLGIGDDAAVVQIPNGLELALSVDTMVEGVHFFENADPADLARKLMAVNLSDMAAMGAQPTWATMTLTTPDYDDVWLASFSQAINDIAQDFGVELIGGDTTQGPLNLSMQIMGLLPSGSSLKRSGAKVGDDVYLSNTVGDAALALKLINKELVPQESIPKPVLGALQSALHCPEPQCRLGVSLRSIASSCIDVSDGLVADLAHIADQSKVSMVIDVARVPLSEAYRQVSKPLSYDLALTGGDDYQLAFTATAEKRAELLAVSKSLGIPISRIGSVVDAADQAIELIFNDKPYILSDSAGFVHFNSNS